MLIYSRGYCFPASVHGSRHYLVYRDIRKYDQKISNFTGIKLQFCLCVFLLTPQRPNHSIVQSVQKPRNRQEQLLLYIIFIITRFNILKYIVPPSE